MTTQEFSVEFDILYNNLASNSAPPVNDYEKSVFLTKAQSDIVIELYSGRNNLGLSFESSEEAKSYLNPLIEALETTITNVRPYQGSYISETVDSIFNMKYTVIIRAEILKDNKCIPVLPVNNDDLYHILNNPFKKPSKKRALLGSEYGNYMIYTDSDYTDCDLIIHVLKKPTPIILNIDGNTEGLTIDEYDVSEGPIESLLPSSLHYMILERAVLLAKMAYVGGQAQQPQQQQR